MQKQKDKETKKQKIIASILILALVLQIAGPVLLLPRQVKAGGLPVVDIPKYIWDAIKWIFEKAKKLGASIAFKNALKTFVGRIAYDTAVWIGSGGEGQKPLFVTKGWSEYLGDVADDAAGDFIETLATEEFGFSVCEPPEIEARLALILGIGEEIRPREPECSFSEMRRNWERELTSRDFLKKFSVSFDPVESDLGAYLILSSRLAEERYREVRGGRLAREEGKGFLGVVSKIAGYIETPAQMVKTQAEKMTEEATKPEETFTGEIIADAIGIFTNTLIAKLLGRLKGGMWTLADLVKEEGRERMLADLESLSGSTLGGRKAAEAVFASLNIPSLREGGEYDLFSEFTTCPSDRRFARLNNCVMDEGLAQAIQNKETIQEAIEQDHLHGDWLVGKDVVYGVELDYQSGYSLANIRKLRKARVFPLGLEFAALKIVAGGENYTLRQVVDGFDQYGDDNVCGTRCGNDDVCGTDDDDKNESPFCKLVDPNWVLTLPQGFCRTRAYGQILEAAESDRRQEYCVDQQSCLYDDLNGNCQGGWGYCVREQNIWRFAGTECPSYFASCQTFQPRKGSRVSYLKDTLDWNCDSNDVGCRWYSKSWNMEQETWNQEDRIYFNRNVEECSEETEGCSEFIEMISLYDGSPGSGEFGGAQSIETIVNQVVNSTTAAYSDFGLTNHLYLNSKRKTCDATEVGCEKYIPVNGDPWIAGAVSETDRCPSECVDYAFYKEMPTPFSRGRDPVALIARNARTCPASEAGCDEFTNLDEVAKGGEGKEYYSYLRQCEKVDENKEPINPGVVCETFYTWVGSDTTGYQLKTYYLKSAGNQPAEVDNPVDLGECNDTEDAINNPECKEFYDDQGNVSYHFYKNTITCSQDCHPYRRTLTDEEDCRASGGSWQEGACIYMAIPREGVACSSENAGCRVYKGTVGNNIRVVFTNDFEDGSVQGWKGLPSSESTDFGGHSLKIITSTEKDVSGLLTANRTYTLSFWAKGGGEILAKLTGEEILEFGKVYSPFEWSGPYTLGPVYLENSSGEIKIEISGTGTFYLDNIILKEITDQYLIRDSWQIPEVCDQIPGDPPIPAPGYMIGCQEYKDRDNRSHYLKSFSKLCSAEAVGCRALIDTHNSTSPHEEKFNQGDPLIDDVVVPADSVVYLIKEDKALCQAKDKGCQKFGLNIGKQPEAEGAELLWEDVYLKNDPDKYEIILCQDKADRCEEFSVGLSKYYFKDPGQKICEYREKVNIGGLIVSGWFKAETNEPCYPDYGIRKSDAPDYDGWVGVCPSSQSTCTEFIDPQGSGPYYYLNNDELDKGSCHGQVSLKYGCVLFNDTSLKNYQTGEENLLYNSVETYLNSAAKGSALVDPSTNEPLDSNIILKVQRDRVCGQWIGCSEARTVIIQGRQKNICTALELCKRVDNTSVECFEPDDSERNLAVLSEEVYRNRDITWNGLDYSGYSIPNQYSIEQLRVNDDKLTYLEKTNTLCTSPAPCSPSVCLGTYWYCDIGVDGNRTRIAKACRGYPEPDSPFVQSVGYISKEEYGYSQPVGMGSGFQNANVFVGEISNDSEACDYTKVVYRNMDKYYFAQSSPSPHEKIKVDEQEYSMKRKDTFLGWRGYCLETDPSRSIENDPSKEACLTWYPTDLLPGEVNIFESDFSIADIGTIDPDFHPYYCLETEFLKSEERQESCSASEEWRCETVPSCSTKYLWASCEVPFPSGSNWEIESRYLDLDCESKYCSKGEHKERWVGRKAKGACWGICGYNQTLVTEIYGRITYRRGWLGCSKIAGIPSANEIKGSGIKRETWRTRGDLGECDRRGAISDRVDIGEREMPQTKIFGSEGFVAFDQLWESEKGWSCNYSGFAKREWNLEDLRKYFVAGDVYTWDGDRYVKSTKWRDWGSGVSPWIKQAIAPERPEVEDWKEGGDGITINGKTSGTLRPAKGKKTFRANLKFFAYAQADQVPIRKIQVDWEGDGVWDIDSPGSYKNRREKCGVEPDPTVCTAMPFELTHKYKCDGPDPCIYYPKVKITDNWGRSAETSFAGSIVIEP